ncbi:MAG: hypothetical protein Q8K31_00970 [Burkholderiaceae bacterium]|nr:hypothetical protein [Burkholderiaceae bacterium]MDO9088840.1 hypothetical protein [Burkholderiaceae bacterium]MDP1967748.1 hypothetical protein [Burkholderiaceae bacterium]
MRNTAAAVIVFVACSMAIAQSVPRTASRSPAKVVAKAVTKGVANKPAPAAVHQIAADEQPLGPAELAIAERVHVGHLPCELGAVVHLSADPVKPGYFTMETKSARYRMAPVVTSTGAVRLEDRHGGAVWLQLMNKSMLMNQKLGQRLADDCMSPTQLIVSEGFKTNPAPNLLEPLPRVGGAAVASVDPAALAAQQGASASK